MPARLPEASRSAAAAEAMRCRALAQRSAHAQAHRPAFIGGGRRLLDAEETQALRKRRHARTAEGSVHASQGKPAAATVPPNAQR